MASYNPSNGLWVFGYGSLCWNPGFEYDKSCIGFIRGYKRRFSQGNTYHRGTHDKPGRVATLIEDKDGIVWGRAFLITGESALSYLAERECKIGGYKTLFAPVYTLRETVPENEISQTEFEDFEEFDLSENLWRLEQHVVHRNSEHSFELMQELSAELHHDEKLDQNKNERKSYLESLDQNQVLSKSKKFDSKFTNNLEKKYDDSKKNIEFNSLKSKKFSSFCESYAFGKDTRNHQEQQHTSFVVSQSSSNNSNGFSLSQSLKDFPLQDDLLPELFSLQESPSHNNNVLTHQKNTSLEEENLKFETEEISFQNLKIAPKRNDSRKNSLIPENCTKLGFYDDDFEQVTNAAIVYIATPENEHWLGDAKVPTLAHEICNTSGEYGHNIDYVLNLAKFVRENCPFEADFHLFELEDEILRQKPNHECVFYEKLEIHIGSQNENGEIHAENQSQVLEFSKRVPSKKLRCLNI